MNFIAILCTTDSKKSAENIAQHLVEERLAACVNIMPKVTSIYSWKGKVMGDEEVLMIIKTKQELFEKVKIRILQLHEYETPEIIALDITDGYDEYLEWIAAKTR